MVKEGERGSCVGGGEDVYFLGWIIRVRLSLVIRGCLGVVVVGVDL